MDTAATSQSMPPANDMQSWIARLFSDKNFLQMGHGQRLQDLNLGMGWLYYGLTRMVRPRTIVVIGSWRGFSPLVFGKALADNAEGGKVIFIDPSLADDFWKNPENVKAHFVRFGVTNIEHHLMTTQEFIKSPAYRDLKEVGIVFIDGFHTAEQAKIDFEAFVNLVPCEGMLLLHDSAEIVMSRIYGADKPYQRTVKLYAEELEKDPKLQVFDMPFWEGVTLVRKKS